MYRRNIYAWSKHLDFILMDLTTIFITFVMVLRFYFKDFSFFSNTQYVSSLILLVTINILVGLLNESHKNVLKRSFLDECRTRFKHLLFLIALHLLFLFLVKQTQYYPFSLLSEIYVSYYLLSLVCTTVLKRIVQKRQIKRLSRNILLISSYEALNENLDKLLVVNYLKNSISGICVLDKDMTGETVRGIPVVASKETLDKYISSNWIDEVYFDYLKDISDKEQALKSLVSAGIAIHVPIKRIKEFEGTKEFIEKTGNEYVITSTMATLTPFQMFEKRLLDIVGGLLGSLVALLLMPIIGYLINKKDPGPILYTSTRIGENGKKFKMYKFRSMVMNADDLKESLQSQNIVSNGMMFKIEHDPRVIGGEGGLGEFIRKTSLDEFPQFWNVLKGDMSVVGTRPPTPDEFEKYSPHHRSRLSTKPGVTGMWQISGRSEITDFEEIVRMDTDYIVNWSIWLDIKIILKTILVVFKRKGSL